mgnify:CR=1 FL=1
MFSIDASWGAQDLDDAFSLRIMPDGEHLEVKVHLPDTSRMQIQSRGVNVNNYIRKAGVSVYGLVHLPMLPSKIRKILSLLPGSVNAKCAVIVTPFRSYFSVKLVLKAPIYEYHLKLGSNTL